VALERQPWRGELALVRADRPALPVAVRVEPVPARDGSVLGFFMILNDLTDTQRAAEARRHLEESLSVAGARASLAQGPQADVDDSDEVIGAILSNASLAAMDIADGNMGATVAPLLQELEASTRRATALYGRVKAFVA
jgi:hypothetical protein